MTSTTEVRTNVCSLRILMALTPIMELWVKIFGEVNFELQKILDVTISKKKKYQGPLQYRGKN
jgi:hypothetical protein